MKTSDPKLPMAGGAASPTAVSLPGDDLHWLMQAYLSRYEHQASQDILTLAQDISGLRHSLMASALNPVPEAGAELEAVLRDTEQATHTILDASEALLNLCADQPDLKNATDDLVMRIFEACSFQDLVGQRIRKIMRLMESIEARVNPEGAAPERDPLLNGPALHGPEVSQATVDEMFMHG